MPTALKATRPHVKHDPPRSDMKTAHEPKDFKPKTRAKLAAAVIAAIALALTTATATALAASFSDTSDGHWVVTEGWLDKAVDAGLMGGYAGTGKFGPDDPVLRGQVATVLFRDAVPDSKATTDPGAYDDNKSPFADNTGRKYYTAAINWATSKMVGVMTGDANGQTVRPEDAVSREELACMLFRYARHTLGDVRPASADAHLFAEDAASVSDWAREAVCWCVENGVMTGKGGVRLDPQGTATRAEMCKMAYMAFDSIAATPQSEPQKRWVPEQGHYEDIYETVHVPAVTHEEPVYTTVVDQEAYTTYTRVYIMHDGYTTTDREEARAYSGEHLYCMSWEDVPEEHPAITHQEQTGTTTVVDVPAHDEQQKTGSKWVVDVPGHWE